MPIGEQRNDDFLLRFIEQWAAATREGHAFALASQEHSDRMLTWAIGLMGAGIWSAHSILSAAPHDWRYGALLPWVFGILFALAGRLAGAEMRERDNLLHYERVHRIEMLLLNRDVEGIHREIDVVLGNKEDLQEKAATVKCWRAATVACYWLSHVLFAVGLVVVGVVAYCKVL